MHAWPEYPPPPLSQSRHNSNWTNCLLRNQNRAIHNNFVKNLINMWFLGSLFCITIVITASSSASLIIVLHWFVLPGLNCLHFLEPWGKNQPKGYQVSNYLALCHHIKTKNIPLLLGKTIVSEFFLVFDWQIGIIQNSNYHHKVCNSMETMEHSSGNNNKQSSKCITIQIWSANLRWSQQ